MVTADTGVEDGGQVSGAGQRPSADRLAGDLADVQAGGFGGAQGAPQPCRLGQVQRVGVPSGGQGGADGVPVPVDGESGGFALPDGVQRGKVIGVGQVLPQHRGCRKLGIVPPGDIGKDRQCVLRIWRAVRLAGRDRHVPARES